MVGDDLCPARARIALAALIIQPLAIIAKSISARSRTALVVRNITAWSARAVIVMDTMLGLFLSFIDGIKRWHPRHMLLPFPLFEGWMR